MMKSPLLSATLLALSISPIGMSALAAQNVQSAQTIQRGSATVAAAQELPPDTLKTFVSSPVQSLDPLYVKGQSAKAVSRLVHRGLVAYSPTILPPRNGAYHQVVPAIADSWKVGPDGKSYIFTLNPEARFQNGRLVTAEDVKYSIERAANPNLNAVDTWAMERLGIIGLKRYQAAQRAGLQEPHLLGVEVIDHDIVQIQLDRPIPYALELLALPLFSIVPRENVEKWWEDFGQNPVGAGPYAVTRMDKQHLVLERAGSFYNMAEVANAAVEVKVIPSVKNQFMAFTRKEIDHAPVPETYLPKVLNDPRWNAIGPVAARNAKSINNLTLTRTVKLPRWQSEFISMNNQRFPFSEEKVRQAFNYAVDKKAIIEDTLHSYAQPMTGIFPPGFPGATRSDALYEQDLDKARLLLFEAGWRDKDYDGDIEPWQNPRLDLVLHYQNDKPHSLDICRKIQQDLKKIGVTVRLAPLRQFQEANPGRLPDFFHTVWSPDILDPSELFYPTFASTSRYNVSRYAQSNVENLIAMAEDITYEPKRYDLYQEAERLLIEDAPWLFLYHPVDYQLVQPRVGQFAAHPQLPLAYEHMPVRTQTASK